MKRDGDRTSGLVMVRQNYRTVESEEEFVRRGAQTGARRKGQREHSRPAPKGPFFVFGPSAIFYRDDATPGRHGSQLERLPLPMLRAYTYPDSAGRGLAEEQFAESDEPRRHF